MEPGTKCLRVYLGSKSGEMTSQTYPKRQEGKGGCGGTHLHRCGTESEVAEFVPLTLCVMSNKILNRQYNYI